SPEARDARLRGDVERRPRRGLSFGPRTDDSDGGRGGARLPRGEPDGPRRPLPRPPRSRLRARLAGARGGARGREPRDPRPGGASRPLAVGRKDRGGAPPAWRVSVEPRPRGRGTHVGMGPREA